MVVRINIMRVIGDRRLAEVGFGAFFLWCRLLQMSCKLRPGKRSALI